MRSAIVALLLAIAAPAAAEPREGLLLNAVTLWLAANFDLPAEAEPPALAVVPDARMVEMRYGPGATVEPGDVVATYDEAARTIYLGEGWGGRTAADLSVLVHEMVHHLQAAANQRFACPAEREKLAYRAQDAWLKLFGESLESAFRLEPAMLLVATVCTH